MSLKAGEPNSSDSIGITSPMLSASTTAVGADLEGTKRKNGSLPEEKEEQIK